ncbi:MAG: aminotransferase class I/II-fold pyridoxal phosphate-dependent enzyme [Thermodesulfobacteriota bacterium]
MSEYRPLTRCVHSGGYLDEKVGGVTTPVYTSSSYRFSESGGEVLYPRYYNLPTQKAVADKMAALENGRTALVVSSGMAAISTTLVALLAAGDHAVIQNDVYGGTFHFLSELSRLGIEYSLVRSQDVRDFAAAVRENTRLVYFETPTNPLLKVVDLRAMAELGRTKGLLTVIDNTFATPINQRPLDYGIDVAAHSGTKYLGGHSDLCCGVVVTRPDLGDKIAETAINHGVVLGAFECYRLERSLKTLALRVRQQNVNALALAEFLAAHPRVKRVYYPGLPDDPGHETAKRQMSGFGGMFSVEIKGDRETARSVVNRLKLFTHAVSLGGVESLVCFPALTSHAKMPAEEREKIGITDALLRFSTGIEDPDDLIADLGQALAG